jgi:hypothetical protein
LLRDLGDCLLREFQKFAGSGQRKFSIRNYVSLGLATATALGAGVFGAVSVSGTASVLAAATEATVWITESNAKNIIVGKTLTKTAPMKLTETEWVKYSDRATGKVSTCVGKYEGPLNNCPIPKPCGLINLMSDECGKNGVALP